MTKYINSVAMAAALTMGMTAGAHAASFSLVESGTNDGGFASGQIPALGEVNDVLAPLGLSNPLDGFFGSAVQVEGTNIRVRADFFGYEAGFTNTFTLDGNLAFSTPLDIETTDINNPLDTAFSSVFSTTGNELLDFSFGTDTTGADISVINGVGENTGVRGFFATFLGATPDQTTTGDVLWLFLDDSGADNDDNHDDLVVRLTVEQVPLPAAGFLLIGALGALGAAKRRSKKKA